MVLYVYMYIQVQYSVGPISSLRCALGVERLAPGTCNELTQKYLVHESTLQRKEHQDGVVVSSVPKLELLVVHK